jgi:GR25 family glycosyltransferase involved in LPS biosynthesis
MKLTIKNIFENSAIIGLKRNIEKCSITKSLLEKDNIFPKIWMGYDCNETGLITKHKYELDNPDYMIGEKTVNMYLSHYSLWQHVSFSKYSHFSIFEDDVRMIDNWKDVMEKNLQILPDDWDLFFIGSCSCQDAPSKIHIGENLFKIDHALCSHAYVINSTSYDVLLEYQKVWAPVDIALTLGPVKKLNTYAVFPRLADQYMTNLIP